MARMVIVLLVAVSLAACAADGSAAGTPGSASVHLDGRVRTYGGVSSR